MYNFYIDYYLWIQLPYDAKEGAFKLTVLYASHFGGNSNFLQKRFRNKFLVVSKFTLPSTQGLRVPVKRLPAIL